MRIVVTGHKGQLGQALQRVLAREDVMGLDLPEADITAPSSIIDRVAEYQPDVVIHAAAMTGVDIISIGALTHSPKALDISLELEP